MYSGYASPVLGSPIFIRARFALPRPPPGTPLRGADPQAMKAPGLFVLASVELIRMNGYTEERVTA
jgi:hypothetical protein